MDWEELESIFDAINDNTKFQLELNRKIIHSIYQVNTSENLKLTDVIKFDWDKEEVIETTKLLSTKQAQDLVNKL